MLGDETTEVSSQLLIALYTDDIAETQGWLPEGQLYQDFVVLLRVYLGWRYKARIQLTVPAQLLAAPVLGDSPFMLGMTGVLGVEGETIPPDIPAAFTIEPGNYNGMPSATLQQGNQRVAYHFD